MRLKWRKAQAPVIDKVLGSNGAHSAPERYELVDTKGQVNAVVQRMGPSWRFGKTPFADLANAKAAAKAFVMANRS
jgi:hypothetical protein